MTEWREPSLDWRAFDTRRPWFELAADDGVAAAQILGALASPTNPDRGFFLLRDWARHEFSRATGKKDWPIRDKPNRLETRLGQVDYRVKRSLHAGDWLRWKLSEMLPHPIHNLGRSIGESARRIGSSTDERNVIRDYWRKYRSLAHIAMSTGDAMVLANIRNARSQEWSLGRLLFKPDWVEDAVRHAEGLAEHSVRFGIIDADECIRFYRQGPFLTGEQPALS